MPMPRRVAGNLALDFANTVSWRGAGRQRDHLATPEGLAEFAAAVGVADAGSPLETARRLREAVGAIGSAFAHRRPAPQQALADLRDMAAQALGGAELSGDPLRPVFPERGRLLGEVAFSALALFGGRESARIRECPFHDCRWLFVDRTKNGTRRWCEMATCGNRAKKIAMAGGRPPGASPG